MPYNAAQHRIYHSWFETGVCNLRDAALEFDPSDTKQQTLDACRRVFSHALRQGSNTATVWFDPNEDSVLEVVGDVVKALREEGMLVRVMMDSMDEASPLKLKFSLTLAPLEAETIPF